MLETKIDKDVLLYKGNVIRGASHLTKRNNPYTQTKITKELYEESFHRLESMGFGSVETTTRNNKTVVIYKKKSFVDIASNLDVLDKWPTSVSFKEYETKRNVSESTNSEVAVD